MYTRCIH